MAKKETVLARPPREVDQFNDPVDAVPDWFEIPGTVVVPRESSEYHQRGPIIIAGYMLRLPPGAPVTDHHEFKVRDEVHQVEGAVADFGRKGKIVYLSRAN